MTRKLAATNPKASRPQGASKVAPASRRQVLRALGAVTAISGGAALWLGSSPAMAEEVVVYKDPSCGCCGQWAVHMRQNGFTVAVNDVEDMNRIKRQAGIPEALESCHTAYVGGYLVEGHVPAPDIRRLLAEQPAVKGLAVPGMPASAPGMDSPEAEPYAVYAFDADGGTRLFASY